MTFYVVQKETWRYDSGIQNHEWQGQDRQTNILRGTSLNDNKRKYLQAVGNTYLRQNAFSSRIFKYQVYIPKEIVQSTTMNQFKNGFYRFWNRERQNYSIQKFGVEVKVTSQNRHNNRFYLKRCRTCGINGINGVEYSYNENKTVLRSFKKCWNLF